MKTIYKPLDFIDKDNEYVDGFYEYTDNIPTLPQRLNRSLQVIKPKSLFILNNKPIILFFDRSVDKEKVFKQCWNFAEAPIIIIENDSDFDIYNGFDYILENGDFLLKHLSKKNEPNYISIISGKYFENSQKEFEKKDKKVDKKLLENIKNAREKLLELNLEYNINIANALLGRVIFIRYLIDRKVSLKFEGKHQVFTNDDLKEILSSKKRTYKLFKYLKSKDGFNGDWFPIEENEETLVNEEHLRVLKNLISGVDIKTNQGSLFDIYDFSIIPIEFISNVYESFIGEEKQKKSGAYYTPTFLVDYILKYTVDDYFKQNPNEYNCKVLDPACGSGIFLVETLRKLINQYEIVTKKPITSKQIIKLVKDNIYGIDYNKNALQISVFSLYLTMLDYQKPSDIKEFKFPYLLESNKNKKPNFFENDFFDMNADYNRVLKSKKLDFIIGNPPYGKSTIAKNSFAEKYIKLNKIAIANRDIVQPFMVRVKDLVGKSTKVSFIVTSKVLYNLQSKAFRTQHFFNKFKVNHILELSSVRKEIFENANVPVSIIFYESSNEEEVLKNIINYISMKPNPYFEKLKILLLSKSDFKKVNQSKLLEYDYLWRILVYGSYLDFNFIKRLKSFITIEEVVETSSQGLMIGGGDKNSAEKYIGMPYIETRNFQKFHIQKTNRVWELPIVHRPRTIDTFKAPALLTSQGIDLNLNIKVGILKKDTIFTSSIASIKTKNTNTLYNIMGIYNSNFFKYFIINIGSYVGIEREKLLDEEKFSIPFTYNENILYLAKNIEEYCQNDFAQYDKFFDDLKYKLNQSVLNAFQITNQEKILIDYANNIMIPWIMQKNYNVAFKKYDYKDEKIEAYINIFIKHYTKIYKELNMYFKAEVLWHDYAIGIYFKVVEKEPKSQIIWKKEKNIQNFLKFARGKELENLFILKDIKGFESDGFYVIKPNEYKNWHEAIGYLDFYEFDKAILGAGRRGGNV
ncbi:Restriction modification enzyme [hydrothermal vent metagenome]|uniref:site-specific DNA-methyltransferase (adenine-specific) n=1 Tax=hydrothermal vent metagenome TaxID=652676 RepID=A0A1W1C240_9ZZZZ